MDMPRPTDDHLKLAKLSGQWRGEETMYPSQWDANGGTALGRTTNRLDLNGFALISDYEQERDGVVNFTGHGVMTYDPGKGEYVLHWFDCMGTPPEVFRGVFDGEVLTLAHGGPGMHARFTYDLSEEGRMKSRMEMSQDGGDWEALFEGVYERG